MIKTKHFFSAAVAKTYRSPKTYKAYVTLHTCKIARFFWVEEDPSPSPAAKWTVVISLMIISSTAALLAQLDLGPLEIRSSKGLAMVSTWMGDH